MPIVLNEFVGFDPKNPKESSRSQNIILPQHLTETAHEAQPDTYFTAKIEAIHADFGTRNFTRYTEDSIRKAVESWTNPYYAPVIMYHNDYDGQVIGRVMKAELAESTKMQGRCLLLTASIPDWHSEEGIRNGILSTVSIGASATDVRCSICGAQLSEGEFCDHRRGEVYDGQTAYWDVHEWEAKEISFVIVPSDKYAGVISYQTEDSDYVAVGQGGQIRLGSDVHESEETGKKTEIPVNIDIKKEHQEGMNNLDIKEAEAKISSLETANKALAGDKVTLQESIDTLNSEKVALQESVKSLKEAAEKKDLEVTHERELREAAEKKITDMEHEVKVSLAESLAALREKAGKPAVEKLEERSIDSLHDSIADIKAEIAVAEQSAEKAAAEKVEAEKKAAEEAAKLKEAEEIKAEKGAVKPESLQESAATAGTEEPAKEVEEPEAEDFDL